MEWIVSESHFFLVKPHSWVRKLLNWIGHAQITELLFWAWLLTSGVIRLFFRLIHLLMCVQVLVCPALCANCCDHRDLAHFSVTDTDENAKTCDCCRSCSRGEINKEEGNKSNPPCEPTTCSDCFCSGALPPSGDYADLFDTMFLFSALPVDWKAIETDLNQVRPTSDRAADGCELFGRGLLRAHSRLLI